ncbi:hypothetical protein BJ742DRAFT_332611 [Cladochytrium replicatum]|nr:hypothetical protein BJ742DRAFT_332611 [Cladochytrium replicatum]
MTLTSILFFQFDLNKHLISGVPPGYYKSTEASTGQTSSEPPEETRVPDAHAAERTPANERGNSRQEPSRSLLSRGSWAIAVLAPSAPQSPAATSTAPQSAPLRAAQRAPQRQEVNDAPPVYEEIPTDGTTLPVPKALLPSPTESTSPSSSRRRSFLSFGRLSQNTVSNQQEVSHNASRSGVPTKIKRLLFTKLTDHSTAVSIPGGAIIYTSQVNETYAKWHIKVSRGTDFSATAESLSSGGFTVRIVTEHSQGSTFTINPVIASTLIKFEFSIHDTVYKWRPSHSLLPIGGWYTPVSAAIGDQGTMCLQRMPKKAVVAAYMLGTGVFDMTEELFEDVLLRDAIVASVFAAMKGHDQYQLKLP